MTQVPIRSGGKDQRLLSSRNGLRGARGRWRLVACAVLALSAGAALADTCDVPDPSAPLTLAFADEFDGDSLDRDKWRTEFLWGPEVIINNEQQYYVNAGQDGYDPFTVRDGVLSITAVKRQFDRSKLYLTRSIYSADTVELLWRVPAGATRYEVYRGGELRGTVTGGAFLDRGLREGIDYPYEVVALDASGRRIVAAQLTVNTADRPVDLPPEPFSLNLRAKVYGADSGEILWDAPYRAGRIEVYRDGVLRDAGFTSLYEAGLEPGRAYRYRVVAYDRCDEVIISDEVTLDTGAGVTPSDDAVARLVIGVSEYSESTAEISWDAVAEARHYDVYDNGVLVQSGDARSLFIDDLVPGIDRNFRVIAYDGDGREVDATNRVVNTADSGFALNRQAFLSGIITSYDSFRFRYGRAEIRARFPAGKGFWSAFWLLNAYYKQDQPEDPEIDVIEAIGDRTGTAFQAYHYLVDRDGDGFHTDYVSVEMQAPIDDFSADFHTYAVDWQPGRIVWYVDGVETNRIEGAEVSTEQMYLIANFAIGGAFPGPPDSTTPFPSSMEIDWIRVYRR